MLNNHAPLLKKKDLLVHFKLARVIYSALLGAIVALIAGAYEFSFSCLGDFFHQSSGILGDFPEWFRYAVSPFFALPFLYLLIRKIPEQRFHTPADLITGIHIQDGKIDAKSSILTAIAAIFAIGFGFSVGYYTPIVLMGAGAGYLLHRVQWGNPSHTYISIGAGAAAAIAAIFHSPIGAVVFVHEVLFRFFSIRAFAPITIAAVTAYIVSAELFNKAIFFDINLLGTLNTPIYIQTAIAGVLAAGAGVLMIHSILYIQKISQKKHWGVKSRLLIAAVVTACLVSLVPQVAGSYFDTAQHLLTGTYFSIGLILLIFVFKWLATTVAIGLGMPGGIFGATLLIGGALGNVLVYVFLPFEPSMEGWQQVLIIATMAAMLSAVIGAPISMILIVIEITGDLQIVSAVMLAVVMANITAYRFMGTSSYFDILLKSQGVNVDLGRDRLYAEHHGIGEMISDKYVSLSADSSIEEAEKLMLDADQVDAYIVDESGNLRGRVRLVDLEFHRSKLSDNSQLATIIQQDPPRLYRHTSIWQAMQMITKTNLMRLPVVDGENNLKLLGVVDNQSLMSCYFTYLKNLRAKENAIISDK